MQRPHAIPTFTLFGETEEFPDVVHCEAFSDRAHKFDWNISAHRHTHMVQLFTVDDGAVSAQCDGKEIELSQGQLLFIPVQTVHSLSIRPMTQGHVTSFPVRLFKTFGAAGTAIQDLLAHSFSSNAPMGLSEDVVRLKATLSHPGPFRAQRAAALAQFLLAQIAECAPASRDQVTEVTALHLRRLDVLIARHQKDGWTVADYAGAMSVTPGHLSRICRDATRTGAGAYIASSAMEEACRLLAFTQMNVAEVGYRVGYNDPSYFSRRFKQIRGCSPKTYRRQFTR